MNAVATVNVDYTPDGETLRAFLLSDAFARVLTGPFGSGKTVASIIEIFRRACAQAPSPDKVRRSKWMAVRSTYPQLERTTIASWRQWFDDRFGRFSWGPPPTHEIVMPLSDGTILNLEVQFVALDGLSAEADLRGFEGTGIWLNELREIPKTVVDFALGRVGRFPAKKDGGPSWYGIIADTNAPDSDHWLYKLAEEHKPEGWEFFKQPGGVLKIDGVWRPNPEAENQANLPPNYYLRQLAGQTEDWIKVYLANEYGYAIDGKVVYPEWRDTTHVAPAILEPIKGLPLYIGLDFGLTPAAILGQRTARGQWRIIDELVTEDMGVVRFAELLNARLADRYADIEQVEAWGDPAGNARSSTDERTCLQIIKQHAKIDARAAPTNDLTGRREAVASVLNRMIDGEPGLLLSPQCTMLRKGFAGGYHFRRVKVSGDERYHDAPDKNAYSHPHDAMQYMLSGAGEARNVIRPRTTSNVPRPTRANGSYSPLARRGIYR